MSEISEEELNIINKEVWCGIARRVIKLESPCYCKARPPASVIASEGESPSTWMLGEHSIPTSPLQLHLGISLPLVP